MELRTDESRNIAYIRLTGPMNKQLILDAFDAAVEDPRYAPGMARLWDFREADLSSMKSTTIMEMAKYSMKFPPGINDVKVAFVTGRDVEFGLSRMFEAFSDDASTSVAVFRSMEEAEGWLSGVRARVPVPSFLDDA